MNPELAYFLKVNLAIAVFYAFYRLFFYKDTFFRLRRTVLLTFFALACLYPLFDIQDWIRSKEPMVEAVTLYANMFPEETETVVSRVVPVSTKSEAASPLKWIYLGYWGVILFLVARFLIQLTSIIQLSFRCRKVKIRGIPVHVLEKPAGPFSFFHLIFIHPESHTPSETEEILEHEQTHVRQRHSVDVILSELFSIICWPNPFVWLLKREVRHNLEYLADNTVIQAGYDSKSYQYHLLGLAHHQASSTLYNNFNVLHLKNRISMMNKKRSKSIGRTKYLLFVPLAGILMLASNIEAVARVTRTFTEKVNDKANVHETSTLATKTSGIDPASGNVDKTVSPTTVIPANDSVYTNVDKKAEYPGGDDAMYKFIAKTIRYPVIALENGIQGRIIAEFTIKKDGTISDIKIVKSVDPSLDKEAIRLIQAMQKWIPAEKDGQKVEYRKTVPILFKTQGEEQASVDASSSSSDPNEVVVIGLKKANVHKTAEFPGGREALTRFINKTLKYPVIASENGIEGTVLCTFTVTEDGTITDAKITNGIDPSLDKEALRIINAMPKWTPAEKDGKKVETPINLPIVFNIPPKDNTDKK